MFEAVDLARLQFALTSIYHWLFVPFTLGMTVTVAILEWTKKWQNSGANCS